MFGGLEKLHEIAGRVAQQDLRAARPPHDIVSKLHASSTQSCDLGRKILHNQVDAVPTARSRLGPIGHCRPAELVGPATSKRSDPSATSANAGAALESSEKPRCFVYQSTAASTSSTM